MKTYMFPGQGSQAKGMGHSLFDSFSQLVDRVDSLLGYSIKELCLEDPRRELSKTEFTQPAVFVVNALAYLKERETSREAPDFLIGHSLGEISALYAAEAFDFETGLRIVQKRGQLMSQADGGAMAAILNADEDTTIAILDENDLAGIDLANFNTPTQIVISGPREEMARAEGCFRDHKLEFYPLNTSGAFHSRYMRDAADEFKAYLGQFEFAELKIPVVANCSAQLYAGDDIQDNLADQMSNSVWWRNSIDYLLGLGDMTFVEIGHGTTLTKMVAEIKAAHDGGGPGKKADTHAEDSLPVASGEAEESPVKQASNGASNVSAEAKVDAWNSKYAIGTRVRSSVLDKEGLVTRTEAVVLFGHRAAVYLEGYNGYFDLDELTVE